VKINCTNTGIEFIHESPDEQQLLHRLWEQEHLFIFQLQKQGERLSFVNLGQKEDVCNISINVMFSCSDPDIQLISNLGHTPFVFHDQTYASVEGFWQGLKFEEQVRPAIAKLYGKEAKKAGKRQAYGEFVHFNGQKIQVGSVEHWLLMEEACKAKFNQHKKAQSALLKTGIRPLFHKPRAKSKTIPGPIMSEIWMNIRSRLRKESDMKSKHLSRLI
jgi:predicted NAD-dependent protein-ADP-ribosyltransferase YbiA (DUF1768 family)